LTSILDVKLEDPHGPVAGAAHKEEDLGIVFVRGAGGVNLHPKPMMPPVTVRQAIGHLQMAGQALVTRRRQELIDAWHKCPPGKSLRKAVPNVSSFESVKLDSDRPSTTQTNHFNWHYAAPRYLMLEKMALIGSFDPNFHWPVKQGHCKKQIGNNVPPRFMRALARHIRERVLSRISKAGQAA
jgi:hypothetical protein